MKKFKLFSVLLLLGFTNNLFCQQERNFNILIASGNNASIFFSKCLFKKDSIKYLFTIKAAQAPNSIEIPRITIEPNITYGKGVKVYLKSYTEFSFVVSVTENVRWIYFDNIDFTNRWQGGLQKTVNCSKLLLLSRMEVPEFLRQIKESDIIRITMDNLDTNKQICTSVSDVNINIPQIDRKNLNRYALIIGNENYKQFEKTTRISSNVPFAQCDALIFRNYAQNILGIDETNILFDLNSTSGMINEKIDILCKLVQKTGSEAEIIFYYAGHGLPDEKMKMPYLIPVDANPRNLISAIKLYDVIQKLQATGAGKVILLLDACFSGGGRDADLMASRSVKIKPKEESVTGNILVVSACSGDETAMAYDQKNHGLFTYFLLSKLRESKGNCNWGEVFDYLHRTVATESLKINQKEQTPNAVFDLQQPEAWRNWKL